MSPKMRKLEDRDVEEDDDEEEEEEEECEPNELDEDVELYDDEVRFACVPYVVCCTAPVIASSSAMISTHDHCTFNAAARGSIASGNWPTLAP